MTIKLITIPQGVLTNPPIAQNSGILSLPCEIIAEIGWRLSQSFRTSFLKTCKQCLQIAPLIGSHLMSRPEQKVLREEIRRVLSKIQALGFETFTFEEKIFFVMDRMTQSTSEPTRILIERITLRFFHSLTQEQSDQLFPEIQGRSLEILKIEREMRIVENMYKTRSHLLAFVLLPNIHPNNYNDPILAFFASSQIFKEPVLVAELITMDTRNFLNNILMLLYLALEFDNQNRYHEAMKIGEVISACELSGELVKHFETYQNFLVEMICLSDDQCVQLAHLIPDITVPVAQALIRRNRTNRAKQVVKLLPPEIVQQHPELKKLRLQTVSCSIL